jgi:hypothetical protein
MAIDRIPGVGPTNADIATAVAAPSAATIAAAVAAPSAATIAAAVAAPSAATIASAVAAPSSATIASAVAAAVPTIGAINTSVANNAPSPNNWVHLGTGSLNGVGSATVSFSSYRQLKIVVTATQGSNGDQLAFRLNGSSADYSFASTYRGYANQNTISLNQSWVLFSNANQAFNQPMIVHLNIGNAALTTFKMFDYTFAANTGATGVNSFIDGFGAWRGTSAVTSVTIFNASNIAFSASAINQFQVFGAN